MSDSRVGHGHAIWLLALTIGDEVSEEDGEEEVPGDIMDVNEATGDDCPAVGIAAVDEVAMEVVDDEDAKYAIKSEGTRECCREAIPMVSAAVIGILLLELAAVPSMIVAAEPEFVGNLAGTDNR